MRGGIAGSEIILEARFYSAGVLYDPFSVSNVDIYDAFSGGNVVVSGLVPVNAGVGIYQVSWTPSESQANGMYYDQWSWNPLNGDPLESQRFSFQLGPKTYIGITDIRDQGLLEADYSDALVQSTIKAWQDAIDRMCRQWFEPREITTKLDGTDSDSLHLPVPIISFEYLKLNEDSNSLDTTLYKVYDSNTFPDDRHNPRIKLIGPRCYRDIYSRPNDLGRLIFRKGRQNQEIKGVFGFVESDGSTPELIKRALTLLVIEKLTNPAYQTSTTPAVQSPLTSGILLEEWTDGHKAKYAEPTGHGANFYEKRRVGLSGITSNPEILDIIRLYRAPISIKAPAKWS